MSTPNHKAPLPLTGPPNGGRTLVLGTLFVASGIALFFANLHRMHRNKEILDQTAGGAIPTWQRRVHQSNHPAFYAAMPLTTLRASEVEPRPIPLASPSREQNNGHSTIHDYLARPNSTREGRYQVPPPQRARGDGSGRAYTKSPDYCMSYEKTPKYWRQKKGGATMMDSDAKAPEA
ncbi:hypothetical protein BJ138DRAFT_1112568 [Hygrophoropsis aurantiaca]|uniref:Uncharacterized protein n=1 Tax=Hygrophoropsis aurantiaca TaxID=72124 RepID=A0ACB8AFQ7_9AGAM|nr:hypothetical protein BJ138DRAFT_1112568 [Hygrophoropsis aurantiaca]